MRGILILTRTLGDIILGNVLVKNIKLQYPEIELDYVIEDKYACLIEDNPNVKNVIRLKSTNDEWDSVLKLISSNEYDKIFMAQQTSATDNMWHQSKQFNTKHLLNFYAKKIDVSIVNPELELFVNDENLALANLGIPKPIIAIHTTTLADVKNWSKFQDLVDALQNKFGCNIIQLGLESDFRLKNVINLALSLKEIMIFFKRRVCNVFVGLDSGLSYVAAAFKIPVIALYGATEIVTSGVYGESVDIILADNLPECKSQRANVRCHGILGGKCQFNSKCIDKITVEEVMQNIKSKLKGV